MAPPPDTNHELASVIRRAIDYRGDVTISRSEGDPVEGFAYDLKPARDNQSAAVRVIPTDGSPRVTIPIDEIVKIEFTGRDTASGKSFETWMKKYVEKKLAGERAAIEPDTRED